MLGIFLKIFSNFSPCFQNNFHQISLVFFWYLLKYSQNLVKIFAKFVWKFTSIRCDIVLAEQDESRHDQKYAMDALVQEYEGSDDSTWKYEFKSN